MPNENATILIKNTIRTLLKKNHHTYSDLSEALHLSEVAVKKFMTTGEITVSRLEAISAWFGYSVNEFLSLALNQEEKPYQFSEQQEKQFLANPEALYLILLIGAGLPMPEIQRRTMFTDQKLSALLFVLERLDLIKTLSSKRYRILVRGPYRMIPDGSLSKKYEPQFINKIHQISASHSNGNSMRLRSELYLSDHLNKLMNDEFTKVFQKYRNLSRLAQEQVSPRKFLPVVSFVFTKQHDIWGELLCSNRLD